MPTTTDTDSILLAVAAFLFAFAVIALIAWAFKTFMLSGRSGGSFLKGRERRLGVVESAAVDGHRKLILIRRDNVEHLIMTGGPVDGARRESKDIGISSRRSKTWSSPGPMRVRCRTLAGADALAWGGKLQIFQHERPKLELDCDSPATVVLLVRQAQLR